ncbi:MAG TPA: helix-hairpin-helix domain-containing protein [Vicinamibacterales bacterium]|jgi:competence ComEA-like helix-hairpin-helix protein
MRAFVAVVACGLLVCAVGQSVEPPLVAQGALPDAPGRETILKVCGTCHAPEGVASVRLSPEGWRDVLKRMVAAGAKASDQELETVFEYVSTQFAAGTEEALNLNTATALDLQTVVGLLRKESAAFIAYREKNGPCKKLEDLKKIPDVDYNKIEARKARLVCM